MKPIAVGHSYSTLRGLVVLGAAATLLGACGSSSSSGASGPQDDGGSGPVCSTGTGPSICIDKGTFAPGEVITVTFKGGPGEPKDWIAIYPSGVCSPTCPSGSTLWKYCSTDTHTATATGVTNGAVTIDSTANAGNWPLAGGTWDLLYLVNDAYSPIAKLSFEVTGPAAGPGTCDLIQNGLQLCSTYDAPSSADKAQCESLGGTWGTTCPTANALGTCAQPADGDVVTYYSTGGTTTSLAEQSCSTQHGTWTSG